METMNICSDLDLHIYFTKLTKSFPVIFTYLKTPNIKEETKFSSSLPIIGSIM